MLKLRLKAFGLIAVAPTILTPRARNPILPSMPPDETNPSQSGVPDDDSVAGDGTTSPSAIASVAAYRSRYGGLLAILLALGVVVANALTLGALVPSQVELSFPEGALVARASDVAEGISPYHDWHEWPHAFAPYAPLTYFAPGLVARMSARMSVPSADGEGYDPQGIYVIGRLQSAAGLAGIALLMMGMARRLGLGLGWGLAAVAGFVHWRLLTFFCLSYRPDAPAVFFSMLALWVMLGGRATLPRALCVFAALMTSMWFKPVSHAVTLVAVVWMARSHGLIVALAATAAYGALGFGLALIINAAVGGLLFSNMLGSLDVGLKIVNSSGLFMQAPPTVSALFLGGIGIAAYRSFRDREDPVSGIFHLAAILSYVVVLILHSRPGADVNYYLEPYALCVLASVCWISGLWRAERLDHDTLKEMAFFAFMLPPLIFPALLSPLVLIAIVTGIGVAGFALFRFRRSSSFGSAVRETFLVACVLPFCLWMGFGDIGFFRTDFDDAKMRWSVPSIQRAAQEAGGPVLSTLPSVALAGAGRDTLMDHVQYRMLSDRGLLSNQAMIDRLDGQHFALIIVPVEDEATKLDESLALMGLFFSGLRLPLLENYEEVRRQGQMVILRPKRRATNPKN